MLLSLSAVLAASPVLAQVLNLAPIAPAPVFAPALAPVQPLPGLALDLHLDFLPLSATSLAPERVELRPSANSRITRYAQTLTPPQKNPAAWLGLTFDNARAAHGDLPVLAANRFLVEPEFPNQVLASLGPASESPEDVAAMAQDGVDAFRLNLAHGAHSWHRRMIGLVRAQPSRPAVLTDIAGPKIRLRRLPHGAQSVPLVEGEPFTVRVAHPTLHEHLKPGDVLLLGDGEAAVRVVRVDGSAIRTVVTQAGAARSRMGVTPLGRAIPRTALSAKDRRDLAFAAAMGVDYVGISFTQGPEDVRRVRAFLDAHGGAGVRLIAKIEDPVGLANAAAILREADGLMVARGDLTLALGERATARAQFALIALGRAAGKPVLVATHLLDSMEAGAPASPRDAKAVRGLLRAGASALILTSETSLHGEAPRKVRTLRALVRAQ